MHLVEKVKIKISIIGNRGFTLLELLIIIFVAGISLSIVLLSAGRIRENTIFKGEVRTLHATLRYAREISLMERTNVTFDLDGEGKNKYWLAKNDHKEHEHVVPAGFSITGKAIAFFPKGNSSGGIIDLKDDKGRGYRFEVDPVLGIASSKGVHSP